MKIIWLSLISGSEILGVIVCASGGGLNILKYKQKDRPSMDPTVITPSDRQILFYLPISLLEIL